MNHPFPSGHHVRSYGGQFNYKTVGPCCRVFDREELPWPCCSLQWRGKQPSWNRVGSRFVPDIAASKCPSYYVEAADTTGYTWVQVLTMYDQKLFPEARRWWYSKVPKCKPYPELTIG